MIKLPDLSNIPSIRRKLLIVVLVTSTIATTVIVSFQFYEEYQHESDELNQVVEKINRSFSTSLAASIWNLNQRQIGIQLKGIENSRDVIGVFVRDMDGKTIATSSEREQTVRTSFEKTISLSFQDGEDLISVGTLHLTLTRDFIINRLKEKMLSFLIMQAVKTFMISFILLFLFSFYVTSHIVLISKYFKAGVSFENRPGALSLNRSTKGRRDEIDELVNMINEHTDETYHMVSGLLEEKELAEKTSYLSTKQISEILHETRNHLNVIIGLNDEMSIKSGLDGQEMLLNLQKKSCEALKRLVSEYIDSQDRLPNLRVAEISNFNLKDLVSECVLLLKPQASRSGKKIKVKSTIEEPYVRGNASKIRQILMNFGSNAIKYGGDLITYTVDWIDSDTANLGVIDNGRGIELSKQSKIFDPYFRAESSKSKKEGTGLGLAIAKETVEAMGGTIAFQSSMDGTTFNIILPLERVESRMVQSPVILPKQKSVRELFAGISNTNVLIADDEAGNRKVLELVFRGTPLDISLVSDGEQAVKKFQNGTYSVALLDIQMPILDGEKAVIEMREIEKKKSLPACFMIALTGETNPNRIRELHESGFDHYICKPVRRGDLLTKVAEVIAKKEAS